jgi:hypothetical protein
MHAVSTQATHRTAQTRIYPDAAHGFLFQYPDEVAADVNTFLAR